MTTLDIDVLEIFKAVAEGGGITRAASRLHRVPSNVTTRIQQLEARLGVRLFNRHHRRLELSTEGQLLLGYADKLLRLAAEAEAALRSGTPRGLLRLGALESTAATRLPPILSRFHAHYPEVQLELVTGTTGALVKRVLAGEIEAAFVAEPFHTDDLDLQSAFLEDLVLIGAKHAPKVSTPKAASRHTIIAFANGCSYRRRLEQWFAEAQVVPGRIMEYGSYHAILACVSAGAGIAIVPRSVIHALGAQAEVSLCSLPPQIAKAKTLLVWRQGHASRALTALQGEITKAKP